jgi:hypothetical protein
MLQTFVNMDRNFRVPKMNYSEAVHFMRRQAPMIGSCLPTYGQPTSFILKSQ